MRRGRLAAFQVIEGFVAGFPSKLAHRVILVGEQAPPRPKVIGSSEQFIRRARSSCSMFALVGWCSGGRRPAHLAPWTLRQRLSQLRRHRGSAAWPSANSRSTAGLEAPVKDQVVEYRFAPASIENIEQLRLRDRAVDELTVQLINIDDGHVSSTAARGCLRNERASHSSRCGSATARPGNKPQITRCHRQRHADQGTRAGGR